MFLSLAYSMSILLKPVATSQINSKFSAAAKFTLSSTTLLVNIICASLILVLTSS